MKSSLVRSSQPLVGTRKARCYEDEKVLVAISRNAAKEKAVAILDMRTKSSLHLCC